MSRLPNCPQCNSEHTYEYDNTIHCPECAHEWVLNTNEEVADEVIKDSNGNVLSDGDAVIVIKDLKVKGSSEPLKQGTKVTNIKIVDGDHNIDCRIPGFGNMSLKSEFLKKA